MYKLGYTSGLAEAKCDEGKSTIKCVGDIVDKLAKKCCDVPKKMRAPSKITEVTNGCFSSAQVIKVCDEFSGNGSDSEESSEDSQNSEDQAAEQAAKTSGSCGGGKSSTTKNKDDTSCKKSCCGGKSTSVNQCTGSRLVDMNVPSTLGDMLDSGLGALVSNTDLTEREFKHLYCENTPYPECATCPYNSKTFQTIERDTDALFRMINDAINELINGRYELATSMFQCPGQMNSLLRETLGPIGAVAAASISGALIGLTAARGAMAAFSGIARAAQYTDFRREVMYSCDKLFRSGSLVGLPRAYAEAVSGILTEIGCSANTLCRITSKSGSARSSCFGNGYNLWGSRSSGRKCVSVPYKSTNRELATEESKEKAERVLKQITPTIDATIDVEDNPKVAKERGLHLPTSERKTYLPSTDQVAKPDKTYYREVFTPEATGGQTGGITSSKKVRIAVEPGDDLELVRTQVGEIFEIEDNGVTLPNPTTQTTDPKIVKDKVYTVRDPFTDEVVDVRKVVPSTTPGTLIDDVRKNVAKIFDIAVDSVEVYDHPKQGKADVGFEKTNDKKAVSGVDYFEIDNNGQFSKISLNVGDDVPSNTYVKIIVPPGTEDDATAYTGTGPCVLDNGTVINTPVFLDAASYDMAIDTSSLITKTGVMAGDMANIEGIGLSVYEIKMAYLLDHEFNLSAMPNDVEAELIPTVLDTIADND